MSDDDKAAPKGGHMASVTLDGDRLVWDVQCHEPEAAPCRLACAEGCESWGDLDRAFEGVES